MDSVLKILNQKRTMATRHKQRHFVVKSYQILKNREFLKLLGGIYEAFRGIWAKKLAIRGQPPKIGGDVDSIAKGSTVHKGAECKWEFS